MPKDYERHEVEEILRLALTSHGDGAISHEDLLAAAAEVGIRPEAVEAAAERWRTEQQEARQRTRIMQRRRNGFIRHLLSFVGVIGTLLAFNLAFGGPYWFYFPALFWSIPLVLHAVWTFVPSEAGLERSVQRAVRREARSRGHSTAPPHGGGRRRTKRAAKVQQLVDDGLDLVLRQLADQLARKDSSKEPRVRVAPHPPPPTDPEDDTQAKRHR